MEILSPKVRERKRFVYDFVQLIGSRPLLSVNFTLDTGLYLRLDTITLL